MNKYSYRYKIKNDGTIALYRIYSNVPYIQIPKVIDGRIVSELADHCFSTRNNHLEDTLICNSDENLYELNFLYAYIKRNVRSQKIINLMQRLEHQTLLDVSDVCSCLSLDSSKLKFQKKKYNNLRQCLKQAIKLETKVLTFLFENKLTSEIAKGHLNNISQLAMLL